MAKTTFPDGIDRDALTPRDPRRIIAFRFALFALILALALFGLFGGGKALRTASDAPAARFAVEGHERLRNGNFFEVRFVVEARQPIADAVIAVPRELFHEVTVNSLVPAPAEEGSDDKDFLLHYGPLEPGEILTVKIDGQLNPPLIGTARGDYRLLDAERELARLPARLEVLP